MQLQKLPARHYQKQAQAADAATEAAC
jgi:hypothetical protein